MELEEFKKKIKQEIDSIIFRASCDLTPIVEDAENFYSLDDVENFNELDDYFDNVVFNLQNAVDDLNEIIEKYEELWG